MTNHLENTAIAQKIADDICQKAYWLDDKCNWTGVFYHSQIANAETILRALPSNFHTGSAGVAFFLSAIYQETSIEIYRKTALGAWYKTIEQLPKIRAEKTGFYEGLGGIAYTLVQSGIWLKSDEIVENGLKLADKICQNLNQSSFDIMEGSAGGIVAIAAINRLFPTNTLEDSIRSGGEYLLNNSTKTQKGISWKTLPTKGPNLTGYSQGNAGIIHALAEVYAICQESKYLHSIEQAVNYENNYFSDKYRNWQDLRLLHQQAAKIENIYATNAWCHGSTGIGLSRLRSYQLTEQAFLMNDCSKSVDFLLTKTYDKIESFTLCHGFVGDLHHLQSFNLVLSDEPSKFQLNQGLNRIKASIESLNLPDTKDHLLQNPSFMQGWAGIGYFLLRLTNDKLPNILTLGL